MNRDLDKAVSPCPPDWTASYGISIKENVTRDGEAVQNELTFDIGIETLEIMDDNKTRVRYIKQNQRFNGLEILPVFDDIAVETGKAFWKLDLLIGPCGEILDIANIKEIQEEWKSRRKYVEMTYKGYLVEEFLDDMQNRVHDDAVLKELLANEYSMCFFMKGVYGERQTHIPHTSVLVNYFGASTIHCSEERQPRMMDNGRRMVDLQGKHAWVEGADNYLSLVFGFDGFNESNFLCHYNGTYLLDSQNKLESANINIHASYEPFITKVTVIEITKTQHHGKGK